MVLCSQVSAFCLGSESSASSESNPVRPPRKSRGKSDSSVLKNEKDNYDKLWATNKNKPNDIDDHVYSVLGELDDEMMQISKGNREGLLKCLEHFFFSEEYRLGDHEIMPA